MSDPQGKGSLDQHGFFVALKLVAIAQRGMEISLANISMETAPPNMVILILIFTLLLVNSYFFNLILMQGEQPPAVIQNTMGMTSTTSLGSFSLTSPTSSLPKTYNWAVTSADKAKYDALFDSLLPVNGKLPGFKV